ncbi:MAG: secretin N-terminal domain-containing protein [Planctomycetota bacterium]
MAKLNWKAGATTLMLCAGMAIAAGGQQMPFPQPPQPPQPAAEATPDVAKFPVRHRNAVELAAQIGRLLGPEATEGVFASPASNEIIVRGDANTRSLVGQVVAKLDQPPPASARPALEAHSIKTEDQLRARRWAESFRGGPGERAAWDARTGQLIVFASAGVQAEVRQQFGGAANGPAPASRPSAPVALQQGVQLLTLSADDLHKRLQSLTGRPLAATWDAERRWLSFPVELGDGPAVQVWVDAAKRTAFVKGEPQAQDAWRKVIASMDRAAMGGDASRGGQATRVVAASGNRKGAIRRALAAVGATEQPGRVAGQFTAAQVEGEQPAPQGQPQAGQPQLGQPPQPGPMVMPGMPDGDSSLMGPVQVEFVEGLDIIVIRGADQDVARVMAIINQIERFSETTAPSIEVLPLKNVASVPMASLLERVYQQVLGPRSGAVSITPLGKPNSLLLIGRAENVQRAKELTAQLDQPMDAATRFEVFPLKNAVASDAKTLIDDYLAAEEEGEDETAGVLTPTARVVADFRSNSLVVSAAPRELAEIAEIIKRIDVAQSAAVDEVRVFALRNSLAAELAEVLRTAISQTGEQAAGEGETAARSASLRFVAIDADSRQRLESGIVTGVRIAADERANSLVVSAPADSMDLIAALIDQLDRSPDAVAELKVFTIANGDAVALVEMLRSLFGTEEDNDDAGGLGAASNSLVRLQLSVDERTNSIIAAGTQADLDVVYAVLTRLDGADTRQRINRVFRLNNAYAVGVAETLTAWLDSRSEAEQEAELAISPFEQIDREVIVVADEASNTLIISATPEYYDEIAELVRQLDERPPMVMMQVLIAEVRLNDTDEFGIELGLQDSLLFDRSLLTLNDFQTITTNTQNTGAGGAVVSVVEETIVNAPLSPGFNFNDVNNPLGNNGNATALANAGQVAAQGLVNFGVGRVNNSLGFGGFVLSASSNAVDMLLRALQENRRLEVLSRPQITMLDGQPGLISVGQNVQRIAGVSFDNVGRQTNNLEDIDVGIILEVTPRISPDGQVVMQVSATRSELGAEDEGTAVFVGQDGTVLRSPAINQIIAETTVMASSGQTIVLGGLLTKSSFEIHRQVPILADIPLLGDLFRFDSVSEERSELLIIMTPRVIRNEQDAEMIKQIESARMSWVLCDVVNLHGPSGLRSRCDEWGAAEAPEVFPTYVPTEGDVCPPATPLEATSQPMMQPHSMESAPLETQPLETQPMTVPSWTPSTLPPPPAGVSSSGVEPAGYMSPTRPPAVQRLPPVAP